jgi:hypothetical protein
MDRPPSMVRGFFLSIVFAVALVFCATSYENQRSFTSMHMSGELVCSRVVQECLRTNLCFAWKGNF